MILGFVFAASVSSAGTGARKQPRSHFLNAVFQFPTSSILIYMTSARQITHSLNKHNPTPPRLCNGPCQTCSSLASCSESLRPLRGWGRQKMTSVIVLQEVLAPSCTEAKSALCMDDHLASRIQLWITWGWWKGKNKSYEMAKMWCSMRYFKATNV